MEAALEELGTVTFSRWNFNVQVWENYSHGANLAHESLLSRQHNHYQHMTILLFITHMNIFKNSEAVLILCLLLANVISSFWASIAAYCSPNSVPETTELYTMQAAIQSTTCLYNSAAMHATLLTL
jgi:hypothetical protein